MQILSLELYKYKRLSLNGTEFFRITPTKPLQLILGSNGSGKSSLILELSPLPANHHDYLKDGYKKITISHNNDTYTLTSNFTSGQKHSFLKNDEELNLGGTLTVQRELVKQEFGITPEIHELLVSQAGFHAMSPNDRRHWFTKLSDINFDYAISVYLKLKEKARDVSGALKLAKNRLVNETAKLITQEEYDLIQLEVDELHNFIQHLMEYRKPVESNIELLKQNNNLIESEVFKLSNALIKKKTSLEVFTGIISIEDIKNKIDTLNSNLEVEKILFDKYIKEFNSLNDIRESVRLTENTNIASLFNQKRAKETEYYILLDKQKLKLKIDDYDTAIRAFDTVYDILNTVFITLPENSSRKYSRQNLSDVSDYILKYKDIQTRMTSDLNKLHSQKNQQEHQRDHDKIECPQCNHKWSRGYDEDLYNRICINIDAIQSQLDEITITLVEKETYLSEIKSYIEIYRDFNNCVQNWPVLKPLWDSIIAGSDITDNPRNVLKTLEVFKYDLSIGLEATKIKREVDELNNLILLSEKSSNADASELDSKIEQVEFSIGLSTKATNFYNSEINKLQQFKKDAEFITELQTRIETLLSTYNTNTDTLKETYRRIGLNDLIKTVQSNLSRKEQTLSEVKIQKAVVKDLDDQITVMSVDHESYKLLVKELSPTDGLIAQGLMGFIVSFVKQMNLVIKKIWAYPLQVIPCGISDTSSVELDYKFPLMIQTKEKMVPDVSKGSSAMKEVVDLAFKLTSMKYLGLSDFPLFLDEFAASFDNAHRGVASEVVKNLLDTTDLSQLFMISHYEQSYGSLVNAEICVLCQNNIVIPKDALVNKHVLIS